MTMLSVEANLFTQALTNLGASLYFLATMVILSEGWVSVARRWQKPSECSGLLIPAKYGKIGIALEKALNSSNVNKSI